MIYVRDDDVLINSSGTKNPVEHFKRVHRWISECDKVFHVPAILLHHVIKDGTPGLLEFPEAIEFIKEETAKGKMRPEVHGLEHVDYAKFDIATIRTHLRQVKDFIHDNFGTVATTWYTPFGANAPHLYDAGKEEGLRVVDCSRINKLKGKHGIVQRFRDGTSPDFLEEDEIFFHWWEGGLRLKRAIEVIKHGSWEAAAAVNDPKWFN